MCEVLSIDQKRTERLGSVQGFDVEAIRADFPILGREIRGRELVYLDSGATSQKPLRVIEAVEDYYRSHNANPHRGIHTLSEESTGMYEAVRSKLARFLNAPAEECVVFTRNCTEAINIVAYSWARKFLKPGDEILATEMEHHSNMVPWQVAAKATGAVVRYIPVTDQGKLDYSNLERLINERTRLVVISGMSNVLGTVNDLGPVVNRAKEVGALVLVDAAQLAPHRMIDFQALSVDFLALAGHKMLGPTGIGALVARRKLLEAMDPFLYGGGMISDVTLEGSSWIDIPWKFEGGTPLVAEVVGFGAALDYLEGVGMENIERHEFELVEYGLDVLSMVKGLVMYGPESPESRGAVFSFNLFGKDGRLIHPHDLGSFLDSRGIAVRAGHHCAKPLMKRYGLNATLRASLYLYNTREEINFLADTLLEAKKYFLGEDE